MKSALRSFIIFFISTSGLAQNSRIDSLKNLLEGNIHGSRKLEIYGDIAFEYRNIDAHKTIEYSELQRKLAIEVNSPKNEAQGNRNIGMGYYKLGEYDTALIYCLRALEIANEANERSVSADVLNTIGNIFYFKGDYDSAAGNYEKAADIQRELGEENNMAGNLTNLGNILKDKGYYSKALEIFKEAQEVFERTQNFNGLANVYHNIAGLYEALDENEKAIEFYERTNELDVKTGNLVGKAITLNSISDIYLEQGDTSTAISRIHEAIKLLESTDSKCRLDVPKTALGQLYHDIGNIDSALYYLFKAYGIAESCDNGQNRIETLRSLGDVYFETGKYDSALLLANQAYRGAVLQKVTSDQSSASELLFRVNKALGNYRLALRFYQEYDSLQNEIFNDKNNREIARVEAEFEFQKQKELIEYENEIAKLELKEEQARQKNLIIIFSSILLTGLIMLFIILRYYRLKKRANEDLMLLNEEIKSQNEEIMQQRDQLESSNRKLVELNDEKNRLMSVVAHDLRSPLNQIKGLLKLIDVEKTNTDDTYKEYIDLASSSAERLSDMVSRILDVNAIESGDLNINIKKTDLGKLCSTVVKDYKITAENKNIAVCEEFSEGESFAMVDPDYFIQILQNLISNAIKFSPADKEIFVCLFNLNDKIKVVVKDQGPGISEEDQEKLFNPFQTLTAKPTAGEDSLGLGLSIVKKYVDEMKGIIYCESELGKGTAFIIEFDRI